jgi:acetoin utilization deacetylase AcuC-like enzyme
MAGIEASGVDVVSRDAPVAATEHILLNHDAAYVEQIRLACAAGGAVLDPDTQVVTESWEAALRSAGAGPAAVAGLAAGEADAAFVATRPPGHHALHARAMGFCIFNNIAITARVLTAQGHKVAIVDWDVHHGNGTQDSFYEDPSVLYVSIHESGFYPGTGHADERGAGAGMGTTINVPLPAGTDGGVYRWLMRWVVRSALVDFAPDWLLVSAGYDAHRDDPLAGMKLESGDYAVMTHVVAGVVAPGRTIYFLEGGYDLAALEASTAATLRGHSGDSESLPGHDDTGESAGWRAALSAATSLS